jgi:hypothetical protein
MSPASPPRKRLRNRLMLAFAGFTLVVAALFGLYVAVFAYAVEDMFFNGLLEREAAEQLQHHADTGQWKAPRESWMRVIESRDQLPDGIATKLAREPRRTEFSGKEGRHYHLKSLQATARGPAAAVGVVGRGGDRVGVAAGRLAGTTNHRSAFATGNAGGRRRPGSSARAARTPFPR